MTFEGFGKEPTIAEQATKMFPKFIATYYAIKDGLAIEGTPEYRKLSQAVMRFYNHFSNQPNKRKWKDETLMEMSRGMVGTLIFEDVLRGLEWEDTVERIADISDELLFNQ